MSSPSERPKRRLFVKEANSGFFYVYMDGRSMPIHHMTDEELRAVNMGVDEMNWLELTLFVNGFNNDDVPDKIRRPLLLALAEVRRPTVYIREMVHGPRDEDGGLMRQLYIGDTPLVGYDNFPPGLLIPACDSADILQLVNKMLPLRRQAFWLAVRAGDILK